MDNHFMIIFFLKNGLGQLCSVLEDPLQKQRPPFKIVLSIVGTKEMYYKVRSNFNNQAVFFCIFSFICNSVLFIQIVR